MRRAVIVLGLLVPAAARASGDNMEVAIGTGVDAGDSTGIAIRLAETFEMSEQAEDGPIYGVTCGYDYWRASTQGGFNIPIGGFVGARTHDIVTTFGAGVGLLGLEENHDERGFGVVPYVGTTLGFELGKRHTLAFEGRISRHVLLGTDDFFRWGVLVMYGTRIGH